MFPTLLISWASYSNWLFVLLQFMSSIAEECNELKKAYDDCFNAWFSEKFLKGDKNLSRCDALLNLYTGCVKVVVR